MCYSQIMNEYSTEVGIATQKRISQYLNCIT